MINEKFTLVTTRDEQLTLFEKIIQIVCMSRLLAQWIKIYSGRIVRRFEMTEKQGCPEHERTLNYHCGMDAYFKGEYQKAVSILLSEPSSSACYGLARGNSILALRMLGQEKEAEELGKAVLVDLANTGCLHPPSWVQFARNYAEAILAQGRLVEALDAFNQAYDIAEKLKLRFNNLEPEIEIEKAHALNSWGLTLYQLDQLDSAIDKFREAQKIYDTHKNSQRTGYAEMLTNYAGALRKKGENTSAHLALKEAFSIVKETGNQDQERRIYFQLVTLNSPDIVPSDAYNYMINAADEAEQQERFSTAYVRRCILAQYALSHGNTNIAENAISDADRIEEKLDPNDYNVAKMRMTKADLLQKMGRDDVEIIAQLVEGADLWFKRLNRRLVSGDTIATTKEMHENFRLLSGILLRNGRTEESLVSFEAGRGLAHALEVDPRYLEHVLQTNPFSDGSISTDFLDSVRKSIKSHDVLITFSVLPPDIVAFIIGQTDLEVVSVTIPESVADRETLFNNIDDIPVLLDAGNGVSAIPGIILDLAARVRDAVRKRIVRALMPYSSLHNIPWRIVLRHVGMDWMNLQCGVEFGLFLRISQLIENEPFWPAVSVTALGFGHAGKINLCVEAREFAGITGSRAKLVENCKKVNLVHGLHTGGILLISCHGKVLGSRKEARLSLKLADGDHFTDVTFPKQIETQLVILSACESGVYNMAWGDFPVGAAPMLLRSGARYCIGTRFQIGAPFAVKFFPKYGQYLKSGLSLGESLAKTSWDLETDGANLWEDLACIELLGGP